MDVFKENLNQLGFSQDEVSIYLAALEGGPSTPLILARNTGIPRTTVYLLLETLIEKKLLVLEEDGSKKSYRAISPDELVKLAQKKKIEMQETVLSLRNELPQLQALFNRVNGSPRLITCSHADEIIKYLETLKSSRRVYLQRSISETNPDSVVDKAMRIWEENMVPVKEILSGSAKSIQQYIADYGSSRHEVKCTSQSFSSCICLVVTDELILYIVTTEKDNFAVVLQGQALAQFEMIRFLMIWGMPNN